MSHFSVLGVVSPELFNSCKSIVKVSQQLFGKKEDEVLDRKIKRLAISDSIAKLLAPYQENNMGDCPDEYLTFINEREAVEKACETVISAGSYMAKENPDFVGKTIGDLCKYRNGLELFDEKFGKVFPEEKGFPRGRELTPLDLVAIYHFEYDCKVGDDGTMQYGWVGNPNSKWDWYQIGGRFTSALYDKTRGGEGCDIIQRKNLDVDLIQASREEQIDTFWRKFQRYITSEDDHNAALFYGFYHDAYRMGLDYTEVDDGKIAKDFEDGNRSAIKDYYKNELTYEKLTTEYAWHFNWRTYAVVSEDGWSAPGDVVWFGASTDSASDGNVWAKNYLERFILSGDPEDYLVLIDCHT